MDTRRALRALNDEQRISLAIWTALALDRMPYLAAILYALRPLNAPGTGTFAVDEHYRLYVDFDTVTPWGADECGQALLHEALHLAYGHADEAREMNVQPSERATWNLAADSAANDDLRDAGCGFIAATGVLPESIGCADYQTASAYLAELRLQEQDGGDGDQEEAGQGERSGSGRSQGGSQQDGGGGDDAGGQPGGEHSQGDSGQAQSGDGQGDGRDPEQGQDSGNGQDWGDGSGAGGSGNDAGSGQGDGQPQGQGGENEAGNHGYQGCGSGAGGTPAPWELSPGDDLDGDAPAAQAGEKAVIGQTLAEAVQQAAKTRGDIPAGLTQRAEEILAKPKVPWRRVLAPLIRRYTAIKEGEFDATYARRNRRRPHTELFGGRVINPGLFAPVPKVVFVRDTSGSVSDDDLNMIGAEVAGVSSRLGIRGRDLMVIDVDMIAYAAKPYKDLETLRDVRGRGGTDMRAGIAAAAKLKPSVIIVATDGYTPWDEHPSTRVPVVACLISGDGEPPAPEVIGDVPKWMHTVVVEPAGNTAQR